MKSWQRWLVNIKSFLEETPNHTCFYQYVLESRRVDLYAGESFEAGMPISSILLPSLILGLTDSIHSQTIQYYHELTTGLVLLFLSSRVDIRLRRGIL